MDDETRIAPMPRPSGAARLRLVLGVVLLILGLGDLLFMNVVLLPQVLAVETPSPSRPMGNSTLAEPPTRPAVAPQVAQPSPTPDEQPAPAATPAQPERATPSFAPLLFYRNSAWLSPESEKVLSKLAVLLKADSTLRVKLDGHTDEFGPERFNQVLSTKRAERARARLQDLGIARARIDIKGYASEQPADTEDTPQARARNRRVEIKLN